jgi:pyruvate/2-oxoglutarate/acetoin dehydrogenase E1 component
MSAVGAKPIVEVQFADYIYPGFNQLVTEISKSCYLSMGKFPVQTVIRVPIGAYGGGGPYHSGSIETTLLSIKGIKVAYPSNAADMKGLMKAAFLDPNPVVMLEHKGCTGARCRRRRGRRQSSRRGIIFCRWGRGISCWWQRRSGWPTGRAFA